MPDQPPRESQVPLECPQKDTNKRQEIFIPVHGNVWLYPEEVAVVDHPTFQRLRRVRQLGLAHMVFPGGTHTRFEHSIGAVHVAQLIVNHVKENFQRYSNDRMQGDWEVIDVDYPTSRFIRLGALLHDVGHLPLGHTLEDELNHLGHHDDGKRLSKIATLKFKQHEVDTELGDLKRPEGGWSLLDLVNVLYGPFAATLGVGFDAFTTLCQIMCKPPKSAGQEHETWQETKARLTEHIPLSICRDIVGNTICADFLDYIYRDWHHLGKPSYQDRRLYQYMEVRHRRQSTGHDAEPRFVINVGKAERIRHDALTDILELLNSRYKLAETVLFHRTKLALTGLLDRCLLEIDEIYKQVGLSHEHFVRSAEDLLIDGSDDNLSFVLEQLATGGTEEGRKQINDALKFEKTTLDRAIERRASAQPLLSNIDGDTEIAHKDTIGELQARLDLITSLIDRLRGRNVYTLAYKLRICDFTGQHDPANPRLKKLLAIYRKPGNRLDFLDKLELLCGLPRASLIMYCPPDATMNAKIAKVNLFIEGEVTAFDDYEKPQSGASASLTRGALWAQIERFYELWSTQVFVEPACWDKLSQEGQENLKSVVQKFLFQMDQSSGSEIVRRQVDVSIKAVREEASRRVARNKTADPTIEKYREFKFPSGLSFSLE